MKDTQLYQQILGETTPWHVSAVRLDASAQTIEIEMALNGGELWGCPECGGAMHMHGTERRRWRHLDSCQFKTFVVADVPRVNCPKDGTQTVKVPWAEPRGRFTTLFERFAIDVMLACPTSQASKLLRISWDEADGIKQRAVTRGLARRKDESLRLGAQPQGLIRLSLHAGRLNPARRLFHEASGRRKGFTQSSILNQGKHRVHAAFDIGHGYGSVLLLLLQTLLHPSRVVGLHGFDPIAGHGFGEAQPQTVDRNHPEPVRYPGGKTGLLRSGMKMLARKELHDPQRGSYIILQFPPHQTMLRNGYLTDLLADRADISQNAALTI